MTVREGLVGDDLLQGIRGMPIRYLSLSRTRVTDAGLRHVSQLPNLQVLGLAETAVTDRGLNLLQQLRAMQSVNLRRTRVTRQGIVELKTALPN